MLGERGRWWWWAMLGSYIPVILVGASVGTQGIGWLITLSEGASIVGILALRGLSRVRSAAPSRQVFRCRAILVASRSLRPRCSATCSSSSSAASPVASSRRFRRRWPASRRRPRSRATPLALTGHSGPPPCWRFRPPRRPASGRDPAGRDRRPWVSAGAAGPGRRSRRSSRGRSSADEGADPSAR